MQLVVIPINYALLTLYKKKMKRAPVSEQAWFLIDQWWPSEIYWLFFFLFVEFFKQQWNTSDILILKHLTLTGESIAIPKM